MSGRTALWWGRFNPEYSRNRVLRRSLVEAGWRVVDFHPRLSMAAAIEAALRGVARPDLVWVPCFRQRDLAAASRFARRHGVPLLFDPLISAWDKQVFERGKYAEGSAGSERVKAWESRLFRAADLVLADTEGHAQFFAESFGVPRDRLAVVPVGAEARFHPAPLRPRDDRPLQVLFYGSFIGLQGPQWIVEAARVYAGPAVTWHLLGEGPELADCRRRADGVETVVFEAWPELPAEQRHEPWRRFADLPKRIHRADILLGVFGTSAKAGRVIPNKVFQALASGRPVITRAAEAYPAALRDMAEPGIAWVAPGDPQALADAVARWAEAPDRLDALGAAAAESYERYFGNHVVNGALIQALDRLARQR